MVRILTSMVVAISLASACSEAQIERNLDEIAASARSAYDDIAAGFDDLIDGLEPGAREALEEAVGAAEEARAATEAFAADPSDETRQALREADARLDDARRRLDRIDVPEGLRDAFARVLDALGSLRREIRRALDQA